VTLLLATAWVLIGGLVIGGVYWSFLITPVSTVFALGASALLAVVVLALVGLIINGTIEIWSRGLSVAGVRRALGSIGSVIPAGLIILVLWWLTSGAELFVAQRSGPISAWFIASFGWDDVSWLFATIRYAALWLRWVFGALLAMSLMATILDSGWSAIARSAWIGRAMRPRALLLATVAAVIIVALPWIYLVPWRPAGLPSTSVELAFIVTKLSFVALLGAIGVALVAREASRP